MDGGGGAPPALEKNAAELTVMDVYDIASAVGQEFERVIDQHGCEAIARLMPKVVRVLEILEVLVSRNHINPEMEELRLELDRLRLERMDRIEKERKHQKVRAEGAGGTRGGAGAVAAGRGESRAPAPPPPSIPRSRWGKQSGGPGCRAGGERAGTLVGTAGEGSRDLRGCCLGVAEGLGVLLWFFFFLPSWKFPSSFPFSTPSPVTAFPFPRVSLIRTRAPSPLLRRG